MKKIISLLLIICLAINIPTTAYAAEQTVPDNSEISQYGNLSGNILNGGFAVKYDGWVYYANYEDENALYKKNESANLKLTSESCNSLVVDEMGNLYYATSDLQYSYINRYSIVNDEKEVLFKVAGAYVLRNLIIDNTKLYYLCNNNIRMLNLLSNTDEVVNINNNSIISFMILYDDSVAFLSYSENDSNSANLYLYNNSSVTEISKNVNSFDVADNIVYYSNEDSICSYDVLSSKNSNLFSGTAKNIIFY